MPHKIYALIVQAIKTGELKEPFRESDFRRACPGLPEGTYRAFFHKHVEGNRGGTSELFIRVAPGQFKCKMPFKYGF